MRYDTVVIQEQEQAMDSIVINILVNDLCLREDRNFTALDYTLKELEIIGD